MVLLGTGGGGFHIDEQELFADGIFRPVGFAIGRFNADPQGDLFGTMQRVRLWGAPRRTGSRSVFLGGDDGGLSSIADGPWPVGPGASALAIADFNEDGRSDVLTANSAGPATNTVSVLLNTTPWPALLFARGHPRDGEHGGQHDQRLRDPRHTRTPEATRCGSRRTEFAGSDPDEFLKTSDSCTGFSIPPQGFCAINVRFAPTVASPARRRRCCCSTTPIAGVHTAYLSGVGTPASGGGGTGPAGRRVPRDRRVRRAPTGRTARPARRDERHGRTVRCHRCRRAPPGPQGATGPRGPAGRDATVRCKPKRSRSGNVQRHLHGALRLAGRALVGARPPRARQHRLRDRPPHRAARPGRDPGARPLAHAARALPAAAHVRRPEGPGDDRLAAGAGGARPRRPPWPPAARRRRRCRARA